MGDGSVNQIDRANSESNLKIWHNGVDWIIAESAAAVVAWEKENYGESFTELEEWEALDPSNDLTIFDEDDRSGPKTTKKVSEWIAASVPGFLCSTEF